MHGNFICIKRFWKTSRKYILRRCSFPVCRRAQRCVVACRGHSVLLVSSAVTRRLAAGPVQCLRRARAAWEGDWRAGAVLQLHQCVDRGWFTEGQLLRPMPFALSSSVDLLMVCGRPVFYGRESGEEKGDANEQLRRKKERERGKRMMNG